MFDIGFSELLVIGVVALIVIGPERLPGVARTLGHLFGRMQRYVNEVKSDIQREIELDELRKLRESVEDSAREIERSVSRELDHAEQEMRELRELVEPATEANRSASALQSDSMAAASAADNVSPGIAPAPEKASVAEGAPAPERALAAEKVTAPEKATPPKAAAAALPAAAPDNDRSRHPT